MMENDVVREFVDKLSNKTGGKFTIESETDVKGVTFGWCRLDNYEDIIAAAEIVAELGGRIMTISPLIIPQNAGAERVEINYHFYFKRVNCTVTIRLPEGERKVGSITPIIKSADWHEREMQEFYNIKLSGHPNPRALFLPKDFKMGDNTMVPLSAAMNGSSTNTLWERVMKSSSEEEEI